MYEELYDKIPDTEEYLARIEMEKPEKLDKAYLDRLIYQHQCKIPFENLDIYYYKKAINIEPPKVFEKIIRNGRGGYCFEMNNLFYCLLSQLGYDAIPCNVKVCGEGEAVAPATHRGTVVTLEGKRYYCDIGFGGPVPAGAMEFVEDEKQIICGDEFWFTREDADWWKLNRKGSQGTEEMLIINPAKVRVEDFMPPNFYCYHADSPNDHFTGNLIANIRTEQGHYSLYNDKLTISSHGEKEVRQMQNFEETKQVLRELFQINI